MSLFLIKFSWQTLIIVKLNFAGRNSREDTAPKGQKKSTIINFQRASNENSQSLPNNTHCNPSLTEPSTKSTMSSVNSSSQKKYAFSFLFMNTSGVCRSISQMSLFQHSSWKVCSCRSKLLWRAKRAKQEEEKEKKEKKWTTIDSYKEIEVKWGCFLKISFNGEHWYEPLWYFVSVNWSLPYATNARIPKAGFWKVRGNTICHLHSLSVCPGPKYVLFSHNTVKWPYPLMVKF